MGRHRLRVWAEKHRRKRSFDELNRGLVRRHGLLLDRDGRRGTGFVTGRFYAQPDLLVGMRSQTRTASKSRTTRSRWSLGSRPLCALQRYSGLDDPTPLEKKPGKTVGCTTRHTALARSRYMRCADFVFRAFTGNSSSLHNPFTNLCYPDGKLSKRLNKQRCWRECVNKKGRRIVLPGGARNSGLQRIRRKR